MVDEVNLKWELYLRVKRSDMNSIFSAYTGTPSRRFDTGRRRSTSKRVCHAPLCSFQVPWTPRGKRRPFFGMAHVTFEVYNTFLVASPLTFCSMIPIFLTIPEDPSPGSSRNIDNADEECSELVPNTYRHASRWGPAPSGRHTGSCFKPKRWSNGHNPISSPPRPFLAIIIQHELKAHTACDHSRSSQEGTQTH